YSAKIYHLRSKANVSYCISGREAFFTTFVSRLERLMSKWVATVRESGHIVDWPLEECLLAIQGLLSDVLVRP
ncbi:MAG: hypothetical protein Q9227_008990, partial [Pyrenula ochraceoflavens]